VKVFALRLKPHDDLKESLNNFVIQEDIKAGFILSAIGSLEKVKIRFANQAIIGLTQKPSKNLISLCPLRPLRFVFS